MGSGTTYVAVAPEVLEELDFSQGALGQDLLTEDIGHLLDGDAIAGLNVLGGTVEECNKRWSREVGPWWLCDCHRRRGGWKKM